MNFCVILNPEGWGKHYIIHSHHCGPKSIWNPVCILRTFTLFKSCDKTLSDLALGFPSSYFSVWLKVKLKGYCYLSYILEYSKFSERCTKATHKNILFWRLFKVSFFKFILFCHSEVDRKPYRVNWIWRLIFVDGGKPEGPEKSPWGTVKLILSEEKSSKHRKEPTNNYTTLSSGARTHFWCSYVSSIKQRSALACYLACQVF